MHTWLVLDADYLCKRAFYALGELRHEELMTGVAFGLLHDIVHLQDQFNTERVVICFDYGYGKRKKLCPEYKKSRRSDADYDHQIANIRTNMLRDIGFNNVLFQEGYEADDIMASFVLNTMPPGDDAVIITADKDLFQMLDGTCVVYNPMTRRSMTRQSFYQKWGLEPERWAEVKAYAGCSTDELPGVVGIGEVTAAKFLRGELKPHLKAYQLITSNEAKAIYRRNLPIVALPYPGTMTFDYVPDNVTQAKWAAVADRMGMHSLRDAAPLPMRRQRSTGFGIK